MIRRILSIGLPGRPQFSRRQRGFSLIEVMMSVVLMLWLILLMENRRRGLFFGKGPSFLNTAGDAVRRYREDRASQILADPDPRQPPP